MTEPIEATKPNQEMIQRWAASLPERMVIEKFFDWLEQQSLTSVRIVDLDMPGLLNRYYDIDRNQLEQERQTLLRALLKQ